MKLYVTVIRRGVRTQHVIKAQTKEEAEEKLKRAYPDGDFVVLKVQDERRNFK